MVNPSILLKSMDIDDPSPVRPPMIGCFAAQNKRGKAWADIPPEAVMNFARHHGGC